MAALGGLTGSEDGASGVCEVKPGPSLTASVTGCEH